MSQDLIRMPDIESLSDLSWRRIEDGVFLRLETETSAAEQAPGHVRRGFRWRASAGWAAAGAIAAAAVVLLLVRGGGDDGSHTSRIATAESSSMVTIGDASLTVAPSSIVIINESSDGAVSVVLERGSVHCAVAPRAGRPPFVVNAGDVRVEVVGTKFAVSREGDWVGVVVDRGIVTIFSRGDRFELGAGQTWPAETAATSAETAETAETSEETQDDAVISEAELELEPEVMPTIEKRAHDRGGKNTTPAKDVETKPSAKERYRAAARLESTDPDAAVAIYRELSKAGGPWASPALYAMGRLQADLGQNTAARSTLERYLERYPSGANAQDARSLLEQLH